MLSQILILLRKIPIVVIIHILQANNATDDFSAVSCLDEILKNPAIAFGMGLPLHIWMLS